MTEYKIKPPLTLAEYLEDERVKLSETRDEYGDVCETPFSPEEYFAPIYKNTVFDDDKKEAALIEVADLLDQYVPLMLDNLNDRGDEYQAIELLGKWDYYLRNKQLKETRRIDMLLRQAHTLIRAYTTARAGHAFDAFNLAIESIRDFKDIPAGQKRRIAYFIRSHTVPVCKNYLTSGDNGRNACARAVADYATCLKLLQRVKQPDILEEVVGQAQDELVPVLQNCHAGYELITIDGEPEALVPNLESIYQCYLSSLQAAEENLPFAALSVFVHRHTSELMEHMLEAGDYHRYFLLHDKAIESLRRGPAAPAKYLRLYTPLDLRDLLVKDAAYDAADLLQKTKTRLDPKEKAELLLAFDTRQNVLAGAVVQCPAHIDKSRGEIILFFTENKNDLHKAGRRKSLFSLNDATSPPGYLAFFQRHRNDEHSYDEDEKKALQQAAAQMAEAIGARDWTGMPRNQGKYMLTCPSGTLGL